MDIAVITETHLNDTIHERRIRQRGYSIVRHDRNFAEVNKCKGGGIIIYLKHGLSYMEPKVQVPKQLEVCWCVINPSQPESVIVAAVYLPPNSCSAVRQLLMSHLITTVDLLRSTRPRSKTILLGDFNKMFDAKSLSLQLGITQVVTQPTRGAAILDQIFSDINSTSPPFTIAPLGTADHCTVIWSASIQQKTIKQMRAVRPLTDSAIREFGRWICSQTWEDVVDIRDINAAAEILQTKLREAYENFFPEAIYLCKSNEPPWMTKRLKHLITVRNRAQSRRQMDRLQRLREEVRLEIRAAKNHWFKRQMTKILGESKKSWYSQIKTLTNRQPSRWNFQPNKDGNDVPTAELVNDYFVDITTTYEPLCADQLPAFLPAEDIPFEIMPWQVAHKLAHLRQNMAVPTDDIPILLMKEFSVELAIPLSHIYNESLKQGKFPSPWKRAMVIPIPKKTSPESPADLRPISLTPTFGKVMEQFMVPLMTADIRQQVDKRQYGNIKGASTAHYLITFMHSLLSELETSGKLFSAVMYDFKKGFDLIDHTVLMQKALTMGLRPNFAQWLADFLRGRSQQVLMPDGTTSAWKEVHCGIPQGTLVGPLAFLVMINDAASEEENRLKYVDDLTIYQSCPINTIQDGTKLQTTTDRLCAWAAENKMVLNEEKCQVMHFMTAKKPIVLPDIVMHGRSLPVITETRLLGVNISTDLNWQAHVDDMIKKASKALYMIYILKRYTTSRDQLVKTYTTYIRPLLEYCAPLFHAGLTAKQASQLEKVQKRALKLIGGFDLSYKQLLEALKLESLADRREKLCLRLAKQMLQSANHRSLFPPQRGAISGKETRNSQMLENFCCSARLRNSSVPHMTSLINRDMAL